MSFCLPTRKLRDDTSHGLGEKGMGRKGEKKNRRGGEGELGEKDYSSVMWDMLAWC